TVNWYHQSKCPGPPTTEPEHRQYQQPQWGVAPRSAFGRYATSVKLRSITSKQISRIYLPGYILQLIRLPVCNHHIAQLLEGIQIIKHARPEECFLLQDR